MLSYPGHVGYKPSLLRRLAASTGSLDAEELTADVRFGYGPAAKEAGSGLEPAVTIDKSAAYTMKMATTCGAIDIALKASANGNG